MTDTSSRTLRRQALAADRDRLNELRLTAEGTLAVLIAEQQASEWEVAELEEEETLAKACDDRLSEAASVVLWRTFGHPRGITREAIRASLVSSPEGLLLERLSRSRWRAMPKSKGVAAIEGSPDRDSWAEALRVLHNGLPVPR